MGSTSGSALGVIVADACLTSPLAEEMGWTVGDSMAVAIGSRRVWLVVGTLVDFQALSPLASPKLVVMDIAQAQSLLGRRGEIHQIDVQVAEGVDRDALMDRLQGRLGSLLLQFEYVARSRSGRRRDCWRRFD